MGTVFKNGFRMAMGILLMLVFGVGIYAFVRQTSGNAYVGGALAFGAKVILFLVLVVGLVYVADRRINQRPR